MANNELSGPVVTTFLAKWLIGVPEQKYTYRIIFVPETIGSIIYLSKNKDSMIKNIIAGFNITCVGDDREYSYLPSRRGNSLSDTVAKHTLKYFTTDYKSYSWADRGSDERQYCAPFIDLPVASIMRTKYGEYKEYHTSLDNLKSVVTPKGLLGGYNILRTALEILEKNCYPVVTVFCEHQLSKLNLYPTLSKKGSSNDTSLMLDLISWSDGKRSLLDIADIMNCSMLELTPILKTLIENNLISIHS